MSAYLGFEPTNGDDYYFVSYNNEDAGRVGEILAPLCGRIPIWYDHGIEYGAKWEETISERLVNCRSVILFFTRGILAKKESYVQKEFRMAKRMNKGFLIVFLDRITEKDVPAAKLSFWDDIMQIQNIEAYSMKGTNAVEDEIMKALKISSGEDKAEDAPKPVSKAVPKPSGGSAGTSADIEPAIEIHVIPPHRVGILGNGYTADEKKSIRNEGVKLLSCYRDGLNAMIGEECVDGYETYRLAKSAMIIIRDQLCAYNIWKYDEDQAMNLFKKNYDANIEDVKKCVLSHNGILPSEKLNLVRQLVRGLEDVIVKLNR